jgi:hypothetical protein
MNYIISSIPLTFVELTYSCENLFFHADGGVFYKAEDSFIFLDGFIFDLTLNRKLELIEILNLLRENYKFPDNITGQYNIVYWDLLTHEKIIINDFVGIRPIFYSCSGEFIVTNNLIWFSDFNFNIDSVNIIQSLCPPYYSSIFERTKFRNVKRLSSNTILRILKNNEIVKIENEIIGNFNSQNIDLPEVLKLITENQNIFVQLNNEKIHLPISGGVDSRITLLGFQECKGFSGGKIDCFTYGNEDFIDNRIASKIARYLGISQFNVNIDNIYQDKKEIEQHIKRGGNILLNIWLPVIKSLVERKISYSSFILLGDILDLLRAKNVKSIRSRKDRILIQLGLLNINKLKAKFTIDEFERKFIQSHVNCYRKFSLLASSMDLSEEIYIESIRADFVELKCHINKMIYTSNYLEFEEIFNILTWGRMTMGNQVNILSQFYESYVCFANRHFIKAILKIRWELRFEDNLTHLLLQNSGLGKFETTQIPIINYNKPIMLKYLIWSFRSLLDQIMMKLDGFLKLNKNRTIKTINWKKIYQIKKNYINYKGYFKGYEKEFDPMIKYYEARMNGSARPLSEIDLTSAITAVFYYDIFRKKL